MSKHIFIHTVQQKLYFLSNGRVVKVYSVSTAKNGLGEVEASECTPSGWHRVADKIGAGEPINTIFKARVSTKRLFDPSIDELDSDWILTRIVRLAGLEQGFNLGRGPNLRSCDSFSRYIYIHGTPENNLMGQPFSHGCIRMRNHEVIELFELICLDTTVFIV